MKNRSATVLAICAGLLAPIVPALAHTSYLLPNYFSLTEGKVITLEGGFAEKFFSSDVALTAQDFHLYHPDGRRGAFKKIVSFDQITILESDIPEQGTYLFTSGERLGRVSTIAKVKGEWVSVNPDDPKAQVPPDSTENAKLQTATVTDVYVTKGAPSKKVLALPPQGRLAITPITHPNAIFMDEGFELSVSYGGKLLAPRAGCASAFKGANRCETGRANAAASRSRRRIKASAPTRRGNCPACP